MMYGASCHRDRQYRLPPPPPPPPPNGSKAISFLLRICTLFLALASAIVMAVKSDCTFSRYGAFVFQVGCNITAAILEAAAIYLQRSLDLAAGAGGEDEAGVVEEEEEGSKLPGMMLVVVDALVLALLFSATAAEYTAASMAGPRISACARFSVQVVQSKLLSLAASAAVILAHVVKDVPLPFNVPPHVA